MQPLRPIDIVLPFSVKAFGFTLDAQEDCDHLPHTKRNYSNAGAVRVRSFNRGDTGHRQTKTTEFKPKVNDVVLIEQEGVPIHKWPMARITEVKSRSAQVINGRTRRKQEYPHKRLFFLEADPTRDPENESTTDSRPKTSNAPNSPETKTSPPGPGDQELPAAVDPIQGAPLAVGSVTDDVEEKRWKTR
ncbi:unnamed protein product [Caenorhabditis bovis]|uniref:DUF5641 domain-containing protein n=1 Tax=Caenorhabditis bovis TaxID=2654633 RepID=A0A8S1F150_9PELO|nr:unnamed protein product [Caenorhabditis bovis]